MSGLRVETYPWLAAPLGGENPQPIFRDPIANMSVVALESLPPDKRWGLGTACGRRVLPYRLQDRYARRRQPHDFRAVVLENENLKAVFLPELGGRLISLVWKPMQRELLFNNPVFQPANLATRDAWFAGGIEWNIGQYGHAFHTCAPVFAAAIPGLRGEQGLRLYDYERCKGLCWQIDFYLPPGSQFLYAFTRVLNPSDQETSMYWWTNTAVPETPDVRVLAPANEAVFVDLEYYLREGKLAYGQTVLPGLPTVGGKDGTYVRNLPFTNEFYFQCQGAKMPWEAALDARGAGFIEASTHPLNIRKLFCWGMHQGGRRWQEFLSLPGQAYLEIQAGLAPSQVHGLTIPTRCQWSWTQAFGYIAADPAKVHDAHWDTAWKTVGAALNEKLTADDLNRIQDECRRKADDSPLHILSPGLGWGALELKRRAADGEENVPAAFAFSDATLGPEQQPWLVLLETGKLPDRDPALEPGQWMIQPEWRARLEKSVELAANRHWLALLHLGVMRMEAFDDAGAAAAWEESLRQRPSAWGWRNLGAMAMRRGAPAEAVPHYRKAWELASAATTVDVSFAIEYLSALQVAGEHKAAWEFYISLPSDLQHVDAVRLLAAKVALVRNDLAFVEAALECDYGSLREGARDLTELWYDLQARQLADRTGRPVDAALRCEVEKNCPPPSRIDFRIIE